MTRGTGFSSISRLILSLDSAECVAESCWGVSYCPHAAAHMKRSLLEMQSQICKSLETPEIKAAFTSLIRPLVGTHQLPALITALQHSCLRCYCSIFIFFFLNYKIFIFLLTFCKAHIPFPHSNTCVCLFHYRKGPVRYWRAFLGRSQLAN